MERSPKPSSEEEADDDYDAGFVEDDVLAEEEELSEADPGAVRRYRFRHPTASGKTIAAAGFVEAARGLGVLILTHRRLLVSQFTRDLTTEGYGDRFTPAILKGATPRAGEPDHDPDLRLVRAPRQHPRPQRVPPRHLRRSAHRSRREDERRDSRAARAALHRHDRDGAADREAGLRRLPCLGGRSAAGGRSTARPDRSTPGPARPAGCGYQLGADRRRGLRGARARRSAGSRGAQPGRREPLPRSLRLHARNRVRGRRGARVQPRPGVPRRRAQGRSRLRANPAGEARRDARRLRARRDQRARQRPAARRGLELASRDGVHASRADGITSRLPAAHRAHHAHPLRGRKRASSSTSSRRARRTTSAWSRCTRCSTPTSTARAPGSPRRRAAASNDARGGSCHRLHGSFP